MLMGGYSNGREIPIGQVVLAAFDDLPCLRSAGSNLWIASPRCGNQWPGVPGSNLFNLLRTGALETL
jgi:flagellar hook protein FlgE